MENDNSIFEIYGEIPCKFSSYYKYSFTFTGIAPDGAKIYLSVGGSGEDIYRYEVSVDSTETLNARNWKYARITQGETEIFEELAAYW